MLKLNDKEIQEFICNETSYFALNIIDLSTREVIFANKAMKKIMVDINAKKCWQSIYGQSDICSWCKADELVNIADDKTDDKPIHEFEHFNEYANRWFKVQKKVTNLEDGRKVLISILVDITTQKESQGKLISTQVKLTQQAQKLKEAQIELKRLASIDSMTNLYNRRYFLDTSKMLFELAKRNGEDISVIMLDIDRFKAINDTYGHKIGDEVIISLSKKLIDYTRKSDVVCRFGGEEFVILLPNTDIDGATVISNKIRDRIENLIVDISEEKHLKFTVSIGVSKVDLKIDKDVESAVNRADKALYEAKNSGRNRVVVDA
ncbi:MAG: GGDEF domain-containing protein [Campylobacterales bacterium]|nr:GGDEF domain-containing protein [Campylobacterales bacterium]